MAAAQRRPRLEDVLHLPAMQLALSTSASASSQLPPASREGVLAGREIEADVRTVASLAVATCTLRGKGAFVDAMWENVCAAVGWACGTGDDAVPVELSAGRLNAVVLNRNGTKEDRRGTAWRELSDPATRLDSITSDGFAFLRSSNDFAQWTALATSLGRPATPYGRTWGRHPYMRRSTTTGRWEPIWNFDALVRAGIPPDVRHPRKNRTVLCHLVERFFSPDARTAARRLLDVGASLDGGNGKDGSLGVLATVCTRDPHHTPYDAKCLLEAIDWLLDAGADIEARDSEGRTPLMHAACHDGAATSALLASRADPNARDLRGRTALHHLCESTALTGRKARYQAMRWLLRSGADPELMDREGRTPLMLAVGTTQAAVVRALAERVDICARRGGAPLGRPLLWDAAIQGHPARRAEYVSLLLDHGADLGARTSEARTLLHALAESREHWTGQRVGQLACARANQHHLDARDACGRTAMMHACRATVWMGCGCCGHDTVGNVLAVRALAEAGTSAAVTDYTGRTAYGLCAGTGPAAAMRRAIRGAAA